MTNEQWRDLAEWPELPNEARAPIEAEIDIFNRFSAAEALPPPHLVRGRYERVAKLAGDLLGALKELPDAGGPAVTSALSEIEEAISEPVPNAHLIERTNRKVVQLAKASARKSVNVTTSTPRLDALKMQVAHYGTVEQLRDWAATTAANIEKGKRGTDAKNARALVRRVDQIFEKYTGKPLNRGKSSLLFLGRLGRLVTPTLEFGTMEEALKELINRKKAR
jgi:hypothetical protein